MVNNENKTILIQGALDIEIQYIISLLQNKKEMKINEYEFFIGTIDNVKVIVSKCQSSIKGKARILLNGN